MNRIEPKWQRYQNDVEKQKSRNHLDNLQGGDEGNVDASVRQSGRYRFFCVDYSNQRQVGQLLKKYQIDTIIHFAAISSVDFSYAHPEETYNNNVTGMLHLLQAVTVEDTPVKRFIHISTDEVYGDSGSGVDEVGKRESDCLEPTNPYAATKAACEQLVHTFRHSKKLPALIVRMNNVYGPHQDDSKVIPHFTKLAMSRKPFTIAVSLFFSK